MSNKLKITSQILKSYFSIAVMMLIIVVVIMSGCKSKKPTDLPVHTPSNFRFVFMADSRGDSNQHPIHTAVLNAIINQVAALSPKPSFVMFGGDMSYRGRIDSVYKFQEFKDLFAPLTSNGISLYTAMGNHELYNQHAGLGYKIANQHAFQSTFSENPSNGPAGYEHLTYSFTSPDGSCFFAVLDAYYLTVDDMPLNLGGNIDATQMSWLETQVAQTTATHKFLFIHTPYYYISQDPEEISSANESYTKLWSFLDANKFDMYACGHSHLFSRRVVEDTVHPFPQTTPQTAAWQNNVVQLINGTCGAGPSTEVVNPYVKTAWNVHNDDDTFYFSVIDVSGGTVTVTSYSGYEGAYTIFDTFTITK
jgi:hypothetical protein